MTSSPDSREVGAARGWGVGHENITRIDVTLVQLHLVFDRIRHCSQMYGDIRKIGDEIACRREDGASVWL